jgi:TP901 family phage tail tape measure protein
MAFDLGTIFAEIGVNTQKLDAGLMQAQTKLAAADKNISGFGQKLTASSTKMMVAGGIMAGAVLAIGVASIKAASEFETSMRNVNSISKQSEEVFAAQSKQVVNLSKTLPQSAKVLADGLYDIASSGFQGADGMKVLEAAAKAASAGLTTTEVSARGVTAVLNAYGLEAEDAAAVSDTMFKTVDKGVITFEELSSTVGDWVGMAKAANISFNEASGAIAYMTTKGIGAAEAGTSLQRMLTGIIKPSEEMAKFIKNAGYESGEMMLKTLGLTGTMKLLNDETGGSITKLIELIPEIRGVRGANALLGSGYEELTKFMGDFKDTTGATDVALKEQSKSLSFQLDILKNNGTALAIELGNKLIPSISGTVKSLNDLKPETKDAIFLFGELLLGATGTIGGLLLLAGAAGKVRLAIIGINTATAGLVASGSAFSKFVGSMASFLAVFGAQTPAIGAFIDDMGLLKNASEDLQVVANNMKRAMLANQASFASSAASNRQSITNIQDLLKAFTDATPATIAKVLELNDSYNNGIITIGQFNDKLYDLNKAQDIVTGSTGALGSKTQTAADQNEIYRTGLILLGGGIELADKKTAEFIATQEESTAANNEDVKSIADMRSAYSELISVLFDSINTSNAFQEADWALTDAQLAVTEAIKQYGAGSREAETAINALDAASQTYIDTAYGVYTSVQATKDEQEAARIKAIEYGNQLVQSGKWGEDEFRSMASQFGMSAGEIDKIAAIMSSNLDNATKKREIEIVMSLDEVRRNATTLEELMSAVTQTRYINVITHYVPGAGAMGGIVGHGVGYALGGTVGMPQAASGMVVPQTGRAIPILAHEYEDIVNTSQQRNLAEWIMGKANSRPDGKTTSNEVILHTIINLDGQVLWENNEKFDLRKLGERV